VNPFKLFSRQKKLDDFDNFLGKAIPALSTSGTLNHWTNDTYENGYSSIRAIANRFMVIKPYAIDNNGATLQDVPVINALSRPNVQMSGVDFRDALAVFSMVHRKTYVLVWERFGQTGVRPASERLNVDKVAGYTILENVSEVWTENVLTYEVYINGKKVEYHPYQVLTFMGVNPSNLHEGYSPSQAAKRWTTLDDYVADYERGFFENGAVPKGQFIITAPTAKDYEDIVDKMQAKHRGAGKNNNAMYSYAALDPNTGKPTQATVQWVPFNQSNSDLDLSSIFEQANRKIDSVYGVSAFIRAIDEAPNFATAQVIERNFVENTVRPFATKFWSRFSHEMNRITGGMGFAVTFELETPNIAEEHKADAETLKITTETVLLLKDAGASLQSTVEALKLPDNWKLLDFTAKDTTPKIENDKPEVDNGGEVINSPDPTKALHSHSETCGHDTKGLIDNKRISEEARDSYEADLETVTKAFMQAQIDTAISTTKAVGDPTAAQLETFTDEFMQVIVTLMVAEGAIEYAQGVEILLNAGLSTAEATEYVLSQETIDAYRSYLLNVAESYSGDTAKSIRSVLDEANIQGLSRADTETALQNVMNTDDYRIKRLARSEVNRAQGIAANDSIMTIQTQTGVSFNKIWNVRDASACAYCISLNGTVTGISQPFVALGDELEGEGVAPRTNDFVDMDTTSAHANCRCYPTYEVASTSKALSTAITKEIHCSSCDRFLGETIHDSITDKLKCSNSACKALAIPTVKVGA